MQASQATICAQSYIDTTRHGNEASKIARLPIKYPLVVMAVSTFSQHLSIVQAFSEK